MNLCHKLKLICSILSIIIAVSSCSSAVFPDIEDNELSTGDSAQDRRYIEQSNALVSDRANIAYDDDSVHSSPPALATDEEVIASAKTIPVIKGQPEGYVEQKVVTNDPGLNKLLEEGSPSVDRPVSDRKAETAGTSSNEQQNTNLMLKGPSVTYHVATFLFENGSSVLSRDYNSKIREIVKLAKDNKAVINVYGYASSRTRNTDIASHKLANFEVSNKRAESVARALKRAGLPSGSIVTEALSDSNPAYLEVMPEGERLNRRAEVYISY